MQIVHVAWMPISQTVLTFDVDSIGTYVNNILLYIDGYGLANMRYVVLAANEEEAIQKVMAVVDPALVEILADYQFLHNTLVVINSVTDTGVLKL